MSSSSSDEEMEERLDCEEMVRDRFRGGTSRDVVACDTALSFGLGSSPASRSMTVLFRILEDVDMSDE